MRLRILLLSSLLLTVALAGTTPVAADSYVVGDCDKLTCAGVCISDAETECFRGGDVCVGVSYQVPQCVNKPPIAIGG